MYVQVVVIAVYTYFLTALLSNQYIHDEEKDPKLMKMDYVPILIILQFIFYMGWLKVAETMLNPFGADDDDFEVNDLIDHNIQTSYLIVDEMHQEHPELLKDQFWNHIPTSLPDRVSGKRSASQPGKCDIFDIDENKQKSVPRLPKRTNTNNTLIQVNDDEGIKLSLPSKDSLKPRADVIDKNYHHFSNVAESQNTIEGYMQKIKSQNLATDSGQSRSGKVREESILKIKYV